MVDKVDQQIYTKNWVPSKALNTYLQSTPFGTYQSTIYNANLSQIYDLHSGITPYSLLRYYFMFKISTPTSSFLRH